MKYIYIPTLCLLFSTSNFAQDSQIDDRRLQEDKQPQTIITPPRDMTQPARANTATQRITLTEEQLLAHPSMLHYALFSALVYHQVENSLYLFDIYQKLDKKYHTQSITMWGNAVKAEHEQRYHEAIEYYQQLIMLKPSKIFQFRLATNLAKSQQFKEAEEIFRELLQQPDLSAQNRQILENYLQDMKRGQTWQFSADLSYLNDKNINNAPNHRQINAYWTAQENQSAQGMQFSWSAQKKHQLNHGYFINARLQNYGKYYWNQKHYNDVNVRLATGLGKANAKSSLVILPFVEQNWYAGGHPQQTQLHAFSKSYGMSVEAKHTLTEQWQLGLYAEYARNAYRTRQHLDGYGQYISISGTYLANPQRYYHANLDYQTVKTQDADDSFQRYGVKLGLGQAWQSGLNTYLSVSYAQRKYQGAMPIFNIKQHNHDYGASLSIAHQKLHWKDIYPRLTWQYQKSDSNIALYHYDKQRLFLEFSKRF